MHSPAPPLVAGAEAPPPEPDVAQLQERGAEGTTTAGPRGGEGGAAYQEDAGGARCGDPAHHCMCSVQVVDVILTEVLFRILKQ
jgi:hypothetical protein